MGEWMPKDIQGMTMKNLQLYEWANSTYLLVDTFNRYERLWDIQFFKKKKGNQIRELQKAKQQKVQKVQKPSKEQLT